MTRTVTRPRTLRGAVVPPGDKSISHRAAIFNAIAEGSARITNFSPGRDCASTLSVLRDLGVSILREDTLDGRSATLAIEGRGLDGLVEPLDILESGNSGTTMRLMAGVLAGQPFLSVMTGDDSLRTRPMARIIAPLKSMGADVRGREHDSLPPLVFAGGKLHAFDYVMPVASGQLKSCIALAALRADGATRLLQPAESRDHTERMLAAMGADVRIENLEITIRPGPIRAEDIQVPGDISSAAFWIVAAAAHPDAEVYLPGIGVNPTRAGVLTVLGAMGADITLENPRDIAGEPVADIVARSSRLRGTEIGGEIVPLLLDEIPVLAVAAAMADGPTHITGAEELRVKETDRIDATARWLTAAGVRCETAPDGLTIHGAGRILGGEFDGHSDHRIAMALGTAGLVASSPLTVIGDRAAEISYPAFWDDLDAITGTGGPSRDPAK